MKKINRDTLNHYKPMESPVEIEDFFFSTKDGHPRFNYPKVDQLQVDMLKEYLDLYFLTVFKWKETPEQKEERERIAYYCKYMENCILENFKTGQLIVEHKGHHFLFSFDPDNEDYYERLTVDIVRKY